jgi:hypothetical protein
MGLRSRIQLRLDHAETSTLLRAGVLGLAGLGLAGLLVELAFLRHWSSAGELIVWPALAAAAAGTAVIAWWPTPRRVRAVRWVALGVVVVGLAGVWFHVTENLTAGPLDRAYAATWDTLSSIEQWLLAVTGGVGPAPALAPGSMSELGLAIALATFRHPVLTRADAGASIPPA